MKKIILTIAGSLFFMYLSAQEETKTVFQISGQIMMDAGYNFNQVNPLYFDVMRPTQLPSYEGEYGTDGNVYFGVRQSMLDFKSFTPTKYGELSTRFAFDLFGVGSNSGQTTFHML